MAKEAYVYGGAPRTCPPAFFCRTTMTQVESVWNSPCTVTICSCAWLDMCHVDRTTTGELLPKSCTGDSPFAKG
jgi:hypothetical protein